MDSLKKGPPCQGTRIYDPCPRHKRWLREHHEYLVHRWERKGWASYGQLFHLQSEHFLPDRSQRLRLSVRCYSIVHHLQRQRTPSFNLNKIASHLQHRKRVAFASNVGWAEALSFYDLDHQVANIFHLVEGVCQSLENIWQFFLHDHIFTHIALFKFLLPFGVRVPVG